MGLRREQSVVRGSAYSSTARAARAQARSAAGAVRALARAARRAPPTSSPPLGITQRTKGGCETARGRGVNQTPRAAARALMCRRGGRPGGVCALSPPRRCCASCHTAGRPLRAHVRHPWVGLRTGDLRRQIVDSGVVVGDVRSDGPPETPYRSNAPGLKRTCARGLGTSVHTAVEYGLRA